MTSSVNLTSGGAVRGIGQRLRAARDQAGISLADAGSRLKMPVKVLEALEREDWTQLGAPVYVRGQLRSYARLLGLPADEMIEGITMPAAKPVELVPHTFTPRIQRVAEQAKLRIVYVVLTAAIAVPVWLATRPHQPLDTGTTAALEVAPDNVASTVTSSSPSPDPSVTPAQPEPLVASMTPPMPQHAVAAADLNVAFNGESWIKVTAPDGAVIEQTLIQPGQQRSYSAGQIGKAVLGNAAAVSIVNHGQSVDLAPFIRANVVRFTVSSDGSLQSVER